MMVDRNKRLAWSAGRAFCLLNGRDLDVPDIATWIESPLIDASAT